MKDKLAGQRFGQLISNAMYHKFKYLWHGRGVNTAEFHERLFYMENDEFVSMLNDYLKSLATPTNQSTEGDSER